MITIWERAKCVVVGELRQRTSICTGRRDFVIKLFYDSTEPPDMGS